ncbi:unnamed protein product, partial [Brenthis ino]
MDLGLITEPYTGNTGCMKAISGVNIYQYNHIDRVKATVVVRAGIGAIMGISNYSNNNISIVQLITRKFKMYIVSVYIEPREDPNGIINKIETFIKHHPHAHILIGGDLNGWHPPWGSEKSNKRGNELLKMILGNDLIIGNKGTTPTF